MNAVTVNMAPSAWPRQFTGYYVFVLLILYVAFGLPKFSAAKTPDAVNKLTPNQLKSEAESGKNSSAKQNDVRQLKKLAHAGNPTAENNLGVLYDCGHGVPRDYVEAANWFRKAAVRGDDLAESNLGDLYANGQGLPRDFTEAIEWWILARADAKPGEAARDPLANNIRKLEGRMSAFQIRRAHALAAEILARRKKP